MSRNKRFWVGCSGFTTGSIGKHRSWSIPDDVDEGMFVEGMQGQPLPVVFKCFVEGGNHIAMKSDMEAAQVLGAAQLFFKINDSGYSGLSDDTLLEKVAPEFIQRTKVHSSGVLDLKSHVSEEDHRHLMDFVYFVCIDSAEKLEEFDGFARSLGVKKIHGLGQHSGYNEHRPQHAWTTHQHGTRQSLVEAMEECVKREMWN
ncbi:hypothetical protein K438DRAFT_1758030 [Mycena galopus ATCC 62051]|nr:hypothetical protein K438DRAFT_1758030 [Mycena galopus ATCC 62051]